MKPALEFRRKQGINRPLPVHARLTREIRADDQYIEMCFTLGPGAGVARMQVRIVPYLDPLDIEPALESGPDAFCAIHQILQSSISPT